MFLDKLTFVVGVIGPFTVLPQIYSIFSTHSANGVSMLTWLLIFIVTFPWILYGIAHKDKSIIVYCASGGRSALAGKVLKDMGYSQIYNMGGFKDWADSGGPTE